MPAKFTIDVETRNFNKHVQQFYRNSNLTSTTVIKKFGFDLLRKIMQKMPVDTGRARAGWFPAAEALGLSTPSGRKGAKALGWGEGEFNEGSWPNYWIELVNSVPYVIYLEYGWSKQAPYGFLRLSMREMTRGQLPKDMTEAMKKAWNEYH